MAGLKVKKILVLCEGNICRSPLALVLLQKTFADLEIDSAGLGALVGNSANEKSVELAQKNGLDLSDHIAKQVNEEMVKNSDLVFVMSERQKLELEKRYAFAKGRTFLIGHWNEASKREVPDPYRKEQKDFDLAYELIESSIALWSKKLS